jgi:peptidoglycan/LPS O-acetylase OafA/YrhL
MKQFGAIEGLRGWLAWAVVFAHLAEVSGFNTIGMGALIGTGYLAVLLFIIISGFVITHMVCERREVYGIYLLRRFMRIFPLFAVACVIGFFAQDLQSLTLSRVSYAGDPRFAFGAEVADMAHSNHEFFWKHGLAHLTMLHGAVSTALLPNAQYAFSMPAWSISLEWQFYLLAPYAITLARRSRGVVNVALVIAVAEVAWRSGRLGQFAQPSFLPLAAAYFAVGIASRLLYPVIAGTVRSPTAIVALVIVICPLFKLDTIPLLAWVIVLAGLCLDRSNAGDTVFARGFRTFLESGIALYFGARSYSIYLGHILVISLCHWSLLLLVPSMRPIPTFLCLAAMAVPLTVVVAELLYRGIERPGIALGSTLARLINKSRPLLVPEDDTKGARRREAHGRSIWSPWLRPVALTGPAVFPPSAKDN